MGQAGSTRSSDRGRGGASSGRAQVGAPGPRACSVEPGLGAEGAGLELEGVSSARARLPEKDDISVQWWRQGPPKTSSSWCWCLPAAHPPAPHMPLIDPWDLLSPATGRLEPERGLFWPLVPVALGDGTGLGRWWAASCPGHWTPSVTNQGAAGNTS